MNALYENMRIQSLLKRHLLVCTPPPLRCYLYILWMLFFNGVSWMGDLDLKSTRSSTTYGVCMCESLHSIYIHAFNLYEQQLTLVMQLQCLFVLVPQFDIFSYFTLTCYRVILLDEEFRAGRGVKVERRIRRSSVTTSWHRRGINPPLSSFYRSAR